ncbi:MAG: glycosyl hydrolase [Bacteroidota bacterium]|nr:glycosyl hydrolase [Bacteroidota bacterium]
MDRRRFISGSALAAAGWLTVRPMKAFPVPPELIRTAPGKSGLWELFRNPDPVYRPFVRWWWNGNKVEAGELVRELQLLKAAGIGGVEINPVAFPSRSEGDDLGKPSLEWLSREWCEMLTVVFEEAGRLGMTCDLIVGSGWPFGIEDLPEEERSQVVVIAVKKVTGPADLSVSREEIFREAGPAVSNPWPGRKHSLLSLMLVPDPLNSPDEITDLSDRIGEEYFDLFVPEGNHALYALVHVNGFMEVINGAPGASGPVIDHFNSDAVSRFLARMSGSVMPVTGPLSDHLRALFTDSMELEGSNWTGDMREEFFRRRGYDIFPYLPFILFRTGAMGNVTDFRYGAGSGPVFSDMVCRMRYDFETTKAELLEERFLKTFAGWCSTLGVRSRMQAYGRGFFPLESSMAVDIPEGESWTMNWLKHRIGEEMPESDYRRGRAYTMVNKYVSSAAHLAGKRLVSCEEMTDTYTVFNTSLENLKVGSDQSTISGVTHSVFHGFNYSPPDAPWPGWLRYGGYFNENNNWWPHFHLLNEYKSRLSALLQNCDMYADIALLPPTADMWSLIGMQNEPFPSVLHGEYLSLVWEAIAKNGSGCDYVSERIIRDSEIKDRCLCYGPRKYNTLFLAGVESLSPESTRKLLEFVRAGGRVFCIDRVPSKSAGWKDHETNDANVRLLVEKMKAYPHRFILLEKPENDYIGWYRAVQERYMIEPWITIDRPDPFLMQIRYTGEDGAEYIFLVNSHLYNSQQTRVRFSKALNRRHNCSVWIPETGERKKVITASDGGLTLDLGPAESLLLAFDRESAEEVWESLPVSGTATIELTNGWTAELRHCRDGSVMEANMDKLTDLKDMPEYVSFSGTVIYRNRLECADPEGMMINLGKVYGTSELKINGESCGVKWYGRRIFSIGKYLKTGMNSIEVTVATSMGNYMKSLTDNPIAQYWTNAGTKNQPLQSMGMTGPVTCYKK